MDIKPFFDKTRRYKYTKAPKGPYACYVGEKIQPLNTCRLTTEPELEEAAVKFLEVMIEARNKFVPSHRLHPLPEGSRPEDDSQLHDAQTELLAQNEETPHAVKQAARHKADRARRKKKRNDHGQFVAQKSGEVNGCFDLDKMAQRSARPRVVDDVPTLNRDTGNVTYDTDEQKQECYKRSLWSDTSDEAPPEIAFPILSKGRFEFEVDRTVTERDVRRAIKRGAHGRGPGHDGIAMDGIKLACDQVTKFLSRFFQACMRLGYEPAAFKRAVTVILRKAGKDTYNSPKSYRPIALLPCVAKLYHRLVTDKVTKAAIDNNLLPGTQYGAPGGNTTKAVQDMLKPVYEAWSGKKKRKLGRYITRKILKVTLLGLDMTAAFDAVPREKLLQRLADVGFPEWILRVIHAFLSNRTTSLKLPRSLSEVFYVNIGIPQGSPLSPILFLFFASSLPDCINPYPTADVKMHTFAYVDDTYLIAVSNSYKKNCEALAKVHEDIMKWSADARINFSPQKYNLMHFRCPKETSGIPTCTPEIPNLAQTPETLKGKVKVLGVTVDSQLTWEHHVTEIEKKVDKSPVYMRRNIQSTWGMSLKAARRFYVGKIRAIIAYACPAWFIHHSGMKLDWSLKEGQIKRLERLQYKCLKQVWVAFGNTPQRVLEKELNVESIRVFLYRTMISARAKALDVRRKAPYCIEKIERPFRGSFRRSTAYQLLDEQASNLCSRARRAIQFPDETDPKSKANKKQEPNSWVDRWLDQNKRNAVINRVVRQDAKKQSVADWDTYKRKRANRHPGSYPPASIAEDWGPESLEYYAKMNRAQSTMLLHCRTGFIGLNYHLHNIKVKREGTDQVIDAKCSCGHVKQTVYHMFIDCPDLRDARKHLQDEAMFLDIRLLLTCATRIAADWAISYFGLKQFEAARADSRFASLQGGD